MLTNCNQWYTYLRNLGDSDDWYLGDVKPVYTKILTITTKYEYQRDSLEPFSLTDLVEVNKLIKDFEKEIMFIRLSGGV